MLFKKTVDKMAKQLLQDTDKIYTQADIRIFFNNTLTTEQLIRVYRRYLYFKNKDIL